MNILRYFAPICLLLAAQAARSADGASVEGTVALPAAAAAAQLTQRYQLKGGESMAPPEPPSAVVFLLGSFPPVTNPPPTAQMTQKGLQFIPSLLPVQRGTRVSFPNKDGLYHNVFSYSKTKRFDLGRFLAEEPAPSQVFDTPGVVKLYCEIHDHMRATILVLDTPHFTKTTTNGAFRLDGLPAGKFRLKAWLDEKTTLEQDVELKSGATARVEFTGK
ncbi:MAG: hypothetical protein HY300_06550 [Verrucomicrobia bacterium]|nr:hypothetical protein [Verrucomicrobiota bacterium]